MSLHRPDAVADAAGPVAEAARQPLLDLLRGFALLGVFMMNIDFFARPLLDFGTGMAAGEGLDAVAAWLVYVFVQGKFWVLFALLFGIGFALMRERAQRAGRPFIGPFLRRLLLLALFGIAHIVLLWPGDILLAYALAALGLLLFADLRGAAAGLLGAALYLGVALLWGLSGLFLLNAPEAVLADIRAGLADFAAHVDAAAVVYASGDFAAITRQRIADYRVFLGSGLVFQLPMMLGVFLIGRWLVDSGRLRDPAAHRGFFSGLALVGLLLGATGVLASLSFGTRFDAVTEAGQATLAQAWMAAGSLPLSLAYLALFVLLATTAAGARLLGLLAPAGRMALTLYLMQSLLASLVFYGYGLGLAGELGRAAQLGFVLLVFALQVVFAHWWLARFQFGPMEWLWRAGTYGYWPPLRRFAAA